MWKGAAKPKLGSIRFLCARRDGRVTTRGAIWTCVRSLRGAGYGCSVVLHGLALRVVDRLAAPLDGAHRLLHLSLGWR